MGSKILVFVVVLLLVFGGYFAYQRYSQQKALDSGAVHWDAGEPTPEQKARFDRENHGETADGQSEHKNETARQSAADEAATPTQMPSQNGSQTNNANDAQNGNQQQPKETIGQRLHDDFHRQDTRYNNGGSDSANMQGAAPMSDTASPNAPNGMHFGGSGMYQWYRQGNLTWRVDTATGRSCIVYATMDEWRKQIVLSHGCGRDA